MKKTLLFSLLLLFSISTLQAQTIEFSDDFESGTGNWVLQGAWGTTTSQANSGTTSLTDSPAGNYAANQNTSATLANGIDLSAAIDASLSFWAIYDIEGGNFDYCYIEASGNGGTTWVNVATFLGEGQLSPWTQYNYSLGGFVGNSDVKIRFRFFSDGGYEVDGIYIDDVEISSSDQDNSPPLILFEPAPFYYSTFGDQLFLTNIIDISGISDSKIMRFYNGNPIGTIGPLLIDGDEYTFRIAELPAGTQVDYYIEATDGSTNLNVATTPTYSYIAGEHLLYDNEQVDFVQSFGPAAMSGLSGCAVRFSLFGTDIKYALIRNYTDANRPNSDMEFHIWADNNGFPGADLITPFLVTPEANLIETSPMTRVDLSGYAAELSNLSGDVFVGYTVPSGETWLVQTTPAVAGRSYVFNGTTWGANTTDDYHFRLVTSGAALPDSCSDATDLSGLMGQGIGNPQTSTIFDNTDATVDGTEPTDGTGCFFDASLENPLWFTFVGDGEAYEITTVMCAGIGDYNDDTQIAVYQGTDCGSLTPVTCNDDGDYANGVLEAVVTVETEIGVTYYMLVDGWEGTVGAFCAQFTQVALIDCDDIAIGTASTDQQIVCFGDTTNIELSPGTVIPLNGELFGFLWSVHSTDVTGSPDPFNEPSWIGNFGQVLSEDDIYTPQLVNDGTQIPAGVYYFTPIVFGGGVDVDQTWQNVDFSNGCIITGNSILVALAPELPPLVPNVNTVDEIIGMMNGEASASATGGSGTYTYTWSNGETTPTITGLSAGSYTVTITDQTGCLEEVVTVTVELFVNAEETAFQNAINIQPNPASERTFLFYNLHENTRLNISLLNPIGQVIEQMEIENALSGNVELATDHLSPGIYFIMITDGEHNAMKRLVIAAK